MNSVKIWTPGSDSYLDELFENLRQNQHNNKTDPLAVNYNKYLFERSAAFSIAFDETGDPTHCSSIIRRDCWPDRVYRILNRMWKIKRIPITKFVSPQICLMVSEQVKWLQNNTDSKLVFVSRQYNHWQSMLIRDFKKYSDLTFDTNNYKYQTCPNSDDDSCWQHIIYHGDDSLLNSWKHK